MWLCCILELVFEIYRTGLLIADAKSFPRQLRITNGSTGSSAITCGLAGPFDCAVAYNNDDDDKTQGRKVTLALFSSADVL